MSESLFDMLMLTVFMPSALGLYVYVVMRRSLRRSRERCLSIQRDLQKQNDQLTAELARYE